MTRQREEEELIDELRAIKKLLILGYLKAGVSSQKEIGAALGLSQSSISKMFPKEIDFRSLRAGGKKSDG